jgi:adenine-specific DNA-methyltransferase
VPDQDENTHSIRRLEYCADMVALSDRAVGQVTKRPAVSRPDFPVADDRSRKSIAGLLARCEDRRNRASAALGSAEARAANGQFFTPAAAAELIASMPAMTGDAIRLLDPGAGSGMLSSAFIARWLAEAPEVNIEVVAIERDATLIPALRETLADCQQTAESAGASLTVEIVNGDFIDLSVGLGSREDLTGGFDVVIQNPPYAKLAAGSRHRKALQAIGADAPNMYAAFLALGAVALKPGGQLVAITPRSFCNGPYFGAFRSYLLNRVALVRVHVFESRGKVFADTGVLQENVVFCGTSGGNRDNVVISQSFDHSDEPTARSVPYSEVVQPNDQHRFIRLMPCEEDTAAAEFFASLPSTLTGLGVSISTGRIVDFRAREQLKTEPESGTVPLIYPGNLRAGSVDWPRDIRKPQWFLVDGASGIGQTMPQGWYCLIKRFSSKEERRRIVASLWSPEEYPGRAAFENHLNVIHADGAGLDSELAAGLTLWLNSSVVDRFFRTFSGHTQVNATDIRSMRFPAEQTLRALAARTASVAAPQDVVDAFVETLHATTPAAA